MQFSGLLFFLSILEAGASAVAIAGLYLSYEDGKKKIGCVLYFKVKLVFIVLKYTYIIQRLFYFACCVVVPGLVLPLSFSRPQQTKIRSGNVLKHSWVFPLFHLLPTSLFLRLFLPSSSVPSQFLNIFVNGIPLI